MWGDRNVCLWGDILDEPKQAVKSQGGVTLMRPLGCLQARVVPPRYNPTNPYGRRSSTKTGHIPTSPHERMSPTHQPWRRACTSLPSTNAKAKPPREAAADRSAAARSDANCRHSCLQTEGGGREVYEFKSTDHQVTSIIRSRASSGHEHHQGHGWTQRWAR